MEKLQLRSRYFQRNLVRTHLHRGETQQSIADIVNVSQPTVHRWLWQDDPMPLAAALELLARLNVTAQLHLIKATPA